MKTLYVYLLLLYLVLAFVSCHSPLERALIAAEDNRAELEKVINHYQQYESDSLKLRAAIFLIENMPGHQSLDGPAINSYYKEMDSILTNHSNQNWQQQIQDISQRYSSSLKLVEDIHVIKAGYLISNIDSAFHVWQEKPWAQHVKFSDFCEYILPYKAIEYQPIENWREIFHGKFEESMDIMKYSPMYQNSSYWACTYVNQNLRKLRIGFTTFDSDIPFLYPSLLVKLPAGSCIERCLIAANVMRSKGIPVGIDFTPQWPFQEQGHSWNVVLANSGKNIIFAGIDSDPGQPHMEDEKMGKVFRYTYAANHDLQELNKKEQYVPSHFHTCFMKDVTQEYMQTCDVKVEVLPELKQNSQYAYLAVFDNSKWVPIHWAKIKRGTALFKDMGKDIIYMPVYYTKEGMRPLSHPFLLDKKGTVHPLNADTLYTQTIYLNRKYPAKKRALFAAERMLGGKIQVSNYEDFRDSLTLYQISDLCSSGKFTNIPDSAWRFWRYLSPDGSFGNISELVFCQKDSLLPIKGKIIGTEGSFSNNPNCIKEAVFDGDPLTFFDAPMSNGAWVGMDFGEKVKLAKVMYIPRTDGNMIQPGDTYQLYWWNINGWQELGKERVAKDVVLKCDKAPNNALFLLRNIDRGKEERIFTYQSNKQIFW